MVVRPNAAKLGSQTLLRGLDVVEVVAEGTVTLTELAQRLGLTRSTAHRLASALIDRRYLSFVPRGGYSLGPKLLELGYKVRDKLDIPRVAVPYLEHLANTTQDTAHLGILDRGQVLFLDKVPGRRRIAIGSRIGETQPVVTTGLGKALLLDREEEVWTRYYKAEKTAPQSRAGREAWLMRMRTYAKAGYALDLEEGEGGIRCVAAPIRDVENRIVAAISISSAAQYMDDKRMKTLAGVLTQSAAKLSSDIGWPGCGKPKLRSKTKCRSKHGA